MAGSSSTMATWRGIAPHYNRRSCARNGASAVCHYSSPQPHTRRPARAASDAAMASMQTNRINVTTRQFLKDLAYTTGAALLTGGSVSLVAAALILLLAR